MEPNSMLSQVADEIEKEEIDFYTLKNTLDAYSEMLIDISELDMESNESRKHMALESGSAIGTTWAAMCINDLLRTRQFLRGIFKAVEKVMGQQKKVYILYAGSDPFASCRYYVILNWQIR